MRIFVLGILITLVSNSQANNDFFTSELAQNLCQKAWYRTGNLVNKPLKLIRGEKDLVAYVFKTTSRRSTIKLVNIKSQIIKEFAIEGNVEDVLFDDNQIIYLTHSQIIIYDKDLDIEISTFDILPPDMRVSKYAYARGLYMSATHYYVAFGRYGVLEMDRKSQKLVRIINPQVPQPRGEHYSLVTDIEGANNKLYFSYDNITSSDKNRAFEGLVIYDLIKGSVSKIIPVNQRVEAYYMSRLYQISDELIISNLHLNFRHKLQKLERSRYMKPFQRLWKYPQGELIGSAYIKEKSLSGCFLDPINEVISSGTYQL